MVPRLRRPKRYFSSFSPEKVEQGKVLVFPLEQVRLPGPGEDRRGPARIIKLYPAVIGDPQADLTSPLEWEGGRTLAVELRETAEIARRGVDGEPPFR